MEGRGKGRRIEGPHFGEGREKGTESDPRGWGAKGTPGRWEVWPTGHHIPALGPSPHPQGLPFPLSTREVAAN